MAKQCSRLYHGQSSPDSKVHGANMGPIWGRRDPGGPHVGPMNFAIWVFKIQLILHSVPLWVMLGVFYEFKIKDSFHEQFFHRNSNLMENLVSV